MLTQVSGWAADDFRRRRVLSGVTTGWEGRRRSACALTPGFEGREGSRRPFGSGPGAPGGGGIVELRRRHPGQPRGSPQARHPFSGCAQRGLRKTPTAPGAGPHTPKPRGQRSRS